MKKYPNGQADYTKGDWLKAAAAAAMRGHATPAGIPQAHLAEATQAYNDAVYMRLIATRNGRLTL